MIAQMYLIQYHIHMNDDVKRLPYISAAPKTPRHRADRTAFIKAGFSAVEIWPERDIAPMIDPKVPYAFKRGDVLVLARHDSAGAHVKTRNALLTRLAHFGVMVEVLGGDPVLYDTPEKLAEFNSFGTKAARAALAAKNKPAKGRGRPKKYEAINGDWPFVCAVWQSPDKYTRQEALDVAKAHNGGKDVPADKLNRKCGARKARKE